MGNSGSGGETRTHNLTVNSRLLCRLSYPGNYVPSPPEFGPGADAPDETSRSQRPSRRNSDGGPGASQLRTWLSRATVWGVRFRIATAAAFFAGFTLGTARRRRGRLRLVETTRPGSSASDVVARAPKVRAVAVLAAERVRDAVGMRLGWRDGEEATDALIVEMTGEVASAINARSLAG